MTFAKLIKSARKQKRFLPFFLKKGYRREVARYIYNIFGGILFL